MLIDFIFIATRNKMMANFFSEIIAVKMMTDLKANKGKIANTIFFKVLGLG